MQHPLKSLEYFQKSYDIRVGQLNEERAKGTKIVGTFCLFVPDEIIFGAGADRIVLCGGRTDTIGLAEQSLPRNICPLIKSSFGAIVDSCCGGSLSCPHVQLVDVAVAEATCDGKKKMYQLLTDYLSTYVLDLPQKPSSPEAIAYFLSELRKFGKYMEGLTGNVISEELLKKEIRIVKRNAEAPSSVFRYEKTRSTTHFRVRGSPGDAKTIFPFSGPVQGRGQPAL